MLTCHIHNIYVTVIVYWLIYLTFFATPYAYSFDINSMLYCSFESNRIIITLDKTKWSKCQNSLSILDERTKNIRESIDRAGLYIRYSRDKRYRRDIKNQLEQELKPLLSTQSLLITTVESFKQSLFKQFKRLLYKQIIIRIRRIEVLLTRNESLIQKNMLTPQHDQYIDQVIMLSTTRVLLDMLQEQTTFEGVLDVQKQLFAN